jgi:pimeloyl-ACP methyl ester carboxylesterase
MIVGLGGCFLANGCRRCRQTGRGRSVYTTELYGPARPPFDVEGRIRNWSAQQEFKLFPNAQLHTQWPGSGKPGDPFFDQFYASQVQLMVDAIKTQEYAQKAVSALLDKIGPAILLTHSQSGTFGFLIADKRPDLVKGVITVEGGGTPRGFTAVGPPKWYETPASAVTWDRLDPDHVFAGSDGSSPVELRSGTGTGSRKARAVLGTAAPRANCPT